MTAWTDARLDELRAHWAAGTSTSQIGRLMGITKGAVIGKAHRLDLPPRRSPIASIVVRQQAAAAFRARMQARDAAAVAFAASAPKIIARVPNANRLRTTWTEHEDRVLVEQTGLGRTAPEIARLLPGRNDEAVRRRRKALRRRDPDCMPAATSRNQQVEAPAPAPSPPVASPAPTPAPRPDPAEHPYHAGQTCQWPTTDPVTRRHRFDCSEPRAPGRPYCTCHHREAHQSAPRPFESTARSVQAVTRREYAVVQA